ncbi:MAG: hypothetical protein COV74_08330 [Candidatus Omnitrophica bacterium CG11_big_fil_rev_8_21_14_0_20_45_26]|uniref:Uncharacterized protein n=1 Tax=Candidatus Abzuiibacterium crystallinum TaxID=1974748 RepID=A0A2H0LM62_9BACT|nr:MAG: hypothetical protein COV74_08330 [Candidatus Omnitrophica bacterium CG11_big_fil_rev_8_21_14_0_20_45_26]PIW63668.1 MAG: hypothetical protein COW12_09215 [Candidatus Omnitrophica bacterium CG12_big_fil_rev_8_21_14_0_65_45_16]
MKKLYALIPCLCLSVFFQHPSLALGEGETAAAQEVSVPVTATPDFQSLLSEARFMAEASEWVGARDRYRALLTLEGLPNDLRETAQKEYEALNMKILFSPVQTEESAVHVVEKGDNLYDIAKKYHTTVDLIRKSNLLTKDTIYPGQKLKVLKAELSLAVDRSANLLGLFADGMLLKTYRVGTGKDDSTPIGRTEIVNKLENPTWYNSGAVIPPDSPKNELGTRWMGFSLQGYGIHGTTAPETIGKHESQGCIRMLNQDVEELYLIVPAGTPVVIKE